MTPTTSLIVTVLDAVGNSSTRNLTVHRQPAGNGVAVIVGGRNDVAGLQSNISYLTNRAYRLFLDAGFAKEKIRYLSTGPQDADSDGANDVYTTTTPAAVHAGAAVGRRLRHLQRAVLPVPDGPRHGRLSTALPAVRRLQTRASRPRTWMPGWTSWRRPSRACSVNVIYEACHSGSFIEEPGQHQPGRPGGHRFHRHATRTPMPRPRAPSSPMPSSPRRPPAAAC